MKFQQWGRVLRVLCLALLLNALLAPLVSGASNAADKLHVIFAIDTNDPTIGSGVEVDLKLLEGEVKRIVAYTGMSLNKKVFKGKRFNSQIVADALSNLSAGPNDVILFYYSGHGFRTKTKRSKWPYHAYPNPKATNGLTGMDFGRVIQALQEKGARLTIAITDACNNLLNMKFDEVSPMSKGKSNLGKGYKALFLKYKGRIFITSSRPPEFSRATNIGSLFTLSFLKALKNEVIKATPSWKSLMTEGAGKPLKLNNGKYAHTPYYELDVTRVRAQSSPPPARNPALPPVRAPAPPPARTPAPPPTRNPAPPSGGSFNIK